jgi:hypothetical protein
MGDLSNAQPQAATGLMHRAPRFVGPGDRVRGEPGAPLRFLLYGSLLDAETRRAYTDLRHGSRCSPHVSYAFRQTGPVAEGSFGMSIVIEAAAAQGMFWSMCDRVVDVSADPEDLVAHLMRLCLDLDQVRVDIMGGTGSARLRSDADLRARAAAPETPNVFLNGLPCNVANRSGGLEGLVRSRAARTIPVGQRPW